MQKEITGNYQSIGWELERHDATNERRRCDSHCGAGEQHGARATRQPEAALLRANAGCGGWLAGAPSADSGAVSSSWPRLSALGSPAGGPAAGHGDQGWTVAKLPSGGGRYFIYRPPWAAVDRPILYRRLGFQSRLRREPASSVFPQVAAPRRGSIPRRFLAELRRAPKPCLHERQAGVLAIWPEKISSASSCMANRMHFILLLDLLIER